MIISYQILCKNEDASLKKLLEFLTTHKREKDEINVRRDSLGKNPQTLKVINKFKNQINFFERKITHTIHNQRGWQVNEKGWINSPDIQDRLFKHNIGIKFNEIPHGRLVNEGKKYSLFPAEEIYSIIHIKSFKKQTSDNSWHDNKERELGLK